MDFDRLNQMLSSESFKKFPCFSREDVFDYLLEEGCDRELAYNTSELIRKGYACSVNKKIQNKFEELPIPAEMREAGRNYLYVFPRAHTIEHLLIKARLAYFAKADSRAFSKIIFKSAKSKKAGLISPR